MALTPAEFLPRLLEVWAARRRPAWSQDEAEAEWHAYHRGRLPWPEMEPWTWQRRMRRLRRDLPPPEVNPDHLAARIQRRRSLLTSMRRSPIFGRSDLSGEEAEIAQMEAELAVLRRLGAAPRKRRRKKTGKRQA